MANKQQTQQANKQQTQQANKQQTQQASEPTNPEMSDALKKAHEARKRKAEEREKLPEQEQIRLGVKEAVRAAAHRMTIGRGNVASTLGRYKGKLSSAEKEKVIEYLEDQLQEIRRAAFGANDEKGKFDL